MKKVYFTSAFLLNLTLMLFISACSKEAWEGGTSTIRGKVYAINYNATFTAPIDSGYLGKEDVFIIYGDEATFGDDQKTNYDGTYEFKYLRKGKYKVYAYSKDSTQQTALGLEPVIKEVEITENGQVVEVADIRIVK